MNEFTYEYLPWRNITRETFEFYGVLTKVDALGSPVSVGFPYSGGGAKVRSRRTKEFYWSGETKPGVFGLNKFDPGAQKAIIITEGELDACSYWQVIRSPVVSVQSASSAGRDVAAVRSEINLYERIYLAFDNDAAGRDATAAVARLFDYNKVYVVRFGTRKDANEYLQHGEGDELRNLYYNAKKYLPASIVNSFADFKDILKETVKQGVPYPWPTLNAMTYGIRTGETVLLKAPEKVGKTAIMHAIEFNILKETDSNVAAIYLEEPKLRHLQAIAGLELKRPVHLPDSGVSDADVFAAVQKAVGVDERLHLYSHFGSDDPDVLVDTIRFLVTARGCKYVLFDHISMAVSANKGDDERRALDYLSTRLEMLVKELDFALIMVSHVNDLGQTRGSRYLTKVSDITIDASRDTLHADEKERRTIHLSIPYNRFCSATGFAGNLVFDPATYTLHEQLPEMGSQEPMEHLSWQTSPSIVPDTIGRNEYTPYISQQRV